jgi:hypothetical protein
LGFDAVVDGFQSKIQKFRDIHYEKKALLNINNDPNKHFHFLPVNSPDSVSLYPPEQLHIVWFNKINDRSVILQWFRFR